MNDFVNNLGGLTKLVHDIRDFIVGQLFVLPKLEEIPDEFDVGLPILIKDQKNTDYCFGFATSSVSEDQEGVELDPLFQVYATKTIIQNNNKDWGADLRSAALSAVNVGSLEASLTPVNIATPRNDILNSATWPNSAILNANSHRKQSFAMVVGPYDHFDNIRATMWLFREQKKTVVAGLTWCSIWLYMGGIIDTQGTPTQGHAFKIFGTKIINGVMYLKAQLSSGKDKGDNGIFYISRDIINSGKEYGAIVFTDIPKSVLKETQENNAVIKDIIKASSTPATTTVQKIEQSTTTPETINDNANVIISSILYIINLIKRIFKKHD